MSQWPIAELIPHAADMILIDEVVRFGAEDIETRLLTADVGVEATAVIIQSLTQKVARKQLTDADALYKSLQEELAACKRQLGGADAAV